MYKVVTVFLIYCVIYIKCDETIFHKCGDSFNCVEDELVNVVNTMDQTGSVPIMGDYLIFEKSKDSEETPRIQEGLIERCYRFLREHELKLRIPKEEERQLIEDSRSSKIKKILLPLLILLKLKAAIIIPAILSAIALVAFKGLGASLIALAISGAAGLKSLLEGHHKSSTFTYEVVPQISSPHWSRSGVDPVASMTPLSSGYHTIP